MCEKNSEKQKKKKNLVLELDGLLPKLYCEREKCIVTREPFGEWIVLQVGWVVLQRRRLEGLRIVLQYTKCIVTVRESLMARG